MLLNKIKAGALQLTLFIAVVITLLLLCFILITNHYKITQIKSQLVLKTIKQTSLGFTKSFDNNIKLNDTIKLIEKDSEINIYNNYWGIYKKVFVTSKIKNNSIKKIGLIGCKLKPQKQKTLYLTDNNRPLVLVGTTKIVGNVNLPKKGVKAGNISGITYYNNTLINGNIQNSQFKLPKLPNPLLNQLKNIKDFNFKFKNNQFLDVNSNSSFTNSFFNLPKIIYSKETLFIDKSIIGNIYIYSEKEIIVQPNSNLKDVILIAPKITVKSNTNARFQAFAQSSINIESNCNLFYPSSLTVFKNNNTNNTENKINIEPFTTINGSILILGDFKDLKIKSQLYLSEKAKVIGEIYSNASVELYGDVFGTIFTNQFITKEKGSIYLNHLFNTSININKLDNDFVGLPILEKSNAVLQWLY